MSARNGLGAVESCGLPPRLKIYLAGFIRRGADSPLRRALKADPAGLLGNIKGLLSSAAGVLGLPEEEVLPATGFGHNNFAADRLEAALAELRAVVLLAREGFSAIKAPPPGAARSADIEASLGGEIFAFEVRRVKALPAGSAEEFLKRVYLKKIRQARISVKKRKARRAGVFIVTDPAGLAPAAAGLGALAARVYVALGRPPGEHICLAAGGAAAFHPPFR